MNNYNAYYKSKITNVNANTSFEAQEKAAIELKAKKRYEVTVVLCEQEGKQIIHSTSGI
tara:strand:- start:30197 stop:30373 length:177 start_codon:yes stop_codon:yes gene_type:complete